MDNYQGFILQLESLTNVIEAIRLDSQGFNYKGSTVLFTERTISLREKIRSYNNIDFTDAVIEASTIADFLRRDLFSKQVNRKRIDFFAERLLRIISSKYGIPLKLIWLETIIVMFDLPYELDKGCLWVQVKSPSYQLVPSEDYVRFMQNYYRSMLKKECIKRWADI